MNQDWSWTRSAQQYVELYSPNRRAQVGCARRLSGVGGADSRHLATNTRNPGRPSCLSFAKIRYPTVGSSWRRGARSVPTSSNGRTAKVRLAMPLLCRKRIRYATGDCLLWTGRRGSRRRRGPLVRACRAQQIPRARAARPNRTRPPWALQAIRCGGCPRGDRGVAAPRSSLSELTVDEACLLMRAYRDRMRAQRSETRYRYALIFKNVGPEAGASLEHAHSQSGGHVDGPGEVQQELNGARRLFAEHRRCFFCRVIADETDPGPRWAAVSQQFIAVCPFASRMPYELWVLPRQHESHFEASRPRNWRNWPRFLQRIIAKLESITAIWPTTTSCTRPLSTHRRCDHYHWHVEIFPRLATTAGFEWGAGYFINPVPPEQAAAILRSWPGKQGGDR